MDNGEGDKRDVRRPMNAFLIFCKRHRSIVREKNPDLDNRSVTRILGDLWANLKEEEKAMYTDLAKQYKDAFMKANPDYKWHNPEKAVVPQKPIMPKPTNMKVLKNDMDLFSEGSIMPGKLADPSNMGGLSLLLMAGQQSDHQCMPSDSLNSNKMAESQNQLKMADNSDGISTTDQKQPSENKIQPEPPDKISNLILSNDAEADNIIQEGSTEELTFKAKKSVDDIVKTVGQVKSAEAGIKDCQKLLKEAILDVKPNKEIHNSTEVSNSHNETIESVDEKENGSNKNVEETTMNKDSEEEESAMVTCGKLVVNHIIDKLYSSEIATAARKIKPPYRPFVNRFDKETTNLNDSDVQNNDQLTEKNGDFEPSVRAKTNSNTFDEPDGGKDQDSTYNRIFTKNTDDIANDTDKEQNLDDTSGFTQMSESSESTRKHLLSESGSTEGEEQDESQPVRKSRRRNRGQRYQELINEGIIQPSKERMAALQQPSAKEEMAEEDFQSIDSYILPETAIRRIRKRTTSESYKDKIFPPDDAKRYKTGDFDLEAHIATLPACPIESMGRKRGFVRSRHSSESSHIRKQTTDESQVIPVFDSDKTVSLPPHVRLPSPQRNTEPVVGSRKRKARKHSITHLIPVPPSIRMNGKQHQIGSIESTALKSLEERKQHSAEDKSETLIVNSNKLLESKDKVDAKNGSDQGNDCDFVMPKNGSGCDMKTRHCDKVEVLNNSGDTSVGAEIDEKCIRKIVDNTENDTSSQMIKSHDVESQGNEVCRSPNIGANKDEAFGAKPKNEREILTENIESETDLDKLISGKLGDRTYKSLQEVDSNIPRLGSDVIPQNEAEDTNSTGKSILQDSMVKIVPSSEKKETDLNFNSKVSS